MTNWRLISATALLWAGVARGQSSTPQAGASQGPVASPQTAVSTINVRSTLVLVPALVRTRSGALVYTLSASDFSLTDNGVEQKLKLEDDAGGQPLALLVVVETGGAGGRQLDTYRTLPAMLDALIGSVPHKVGVVAFDSHPELVQKFTPHMDRIGLALNNLEPGDQKAATLDALAFAVKILSAQPPEYRRAILLLSETVDHGSTTSLADALRAVSDTNTVIYTAAFHSGSSEAKEYASRELPTEPGIGGFVNEHPNPPTGCMGKDPDPEAPTQSKAAQAYDCLGQLLPPLALAKLAAIAAKDGLSRNTPETVAHLTGGEYYKFNNVKSLEQDLQTISNHIPNRYLLSFHPQSPEPGIHALELTLKEHPELKVTARSSYWLDPESQPKP